MMLAKALLALLAARQVAALERLGRRSVARALLASVCRPDHERFANVTLNASAPVGGGDKCMKDLWPNVANACNKMPTYHDVCQVRVQGLARKYNGSCDKYCSSFGFACSSGYAAAAPAAASQDCHETASGIAAYFTCDQQIPGPDGVCVCRDPYDTFLWRGAVKTCGPGRALVRDADSCGGYCKSQGLSCEGAEPALAGDCGASSSSSSPDACDAAIADGGAVCQCGGSFDRTGAHKWPDQLETCGATAVLVAHRVLKAHEGTCGGYCKSLRNRVPGYDMYFSCYGGWPADARGCAPYRQMLRAEGQGSQDAAASGEQGCSEAMDGDAVCACSFADL